jgi:hypothetical protein
MAKIRGKMIDRNRYGKRYPFIRSTKRFSYLGDSDLAIELGTIVFNGESEKIFYFEEKFGDTSYVVMAMARDTIDGNSAQVSLMVDGTTLNRSYVKIVASEIFTGKVDVLAIKVG